MVLFFCTLWINVDIFLQEIVTLIILDKHLHFLYSIYYGKVYFKPDTDRTANTTMNFSLQSYLSLFVLYLCICSCAHIINLWHKIDKKERGGEEIKKIIKMSSTKVLTAFSSQYFKTLWQRKILNSQLQILNFKFFS